MDLEDELSIWDNWGSAVAISPDGNAYAYIARSEDESKENSRYIYIQRFDQLKPIRLEATAKVGRFAFSPRSQWIAFQSGEFIKKVSVDGGPATIVHEEAAIRALDWSDDEWILFNSEWDKGLNDGSLMRVSVNEGKVEMLTSLQANEKAHRSPQLLPGGHSLLYTSSDNTGFESGSIKAVRLPEGKPMTVVKKGYDARYISSGHLLYLVEGSLLAAPFDLETLTVTGDAKSVISSVANGENGDGHYSVSNDGTLIYIEGGIFRGEKFELAWINSEGKPELLLPSDRYKDFNLSVDGEHLAYVLIQDQQQDLWVMETSQGSPSKIRLTDDRAEEVNPVWSPSGKSVIFTSDLNGVEELYWKNVDHLSTPTRLMQTEHLRAESWHPNGEFLIATEEKPGMDPNLLILQLLGDDEKGWTVGKVTDLQSTIKPERHGQFSPDGNWIAYQLHLNDQPQVYVLPFPRQGQGRGVRISMLETRTNWPVWSRKSNELLFGNRITPTYRKSQVFKVEYTVQDGEFSISPPVSWKGSTFVQAQAKKSFDLDPNRNRILVRKQENSEEEYGEEKHHIVLFENFFKYLNEKVPVASKPSP